MALQFLSENRFTACPITEEPQEEAFSRDWQELLRRSHGWELLRDICVELRFPVREGMGSNMDFLEAVRRGIIPSVSVDAWTPEEPESIRVYLHQTPVGSVPVIEAGNDNDFIRLLQSLAYRCEPYPVPDSRGAGIIKNYNNWARIRMLNERFEQEHPGGSWSGRFAEIRGESALYRDYIILLSHRYYSGVAPEAFELSEAVWREKSLEIRREHEIAHYMTQRFYHSAKNEIHDEIIADFMGLTAAFGHYDPDKFITFLGLESYPAYRKGGRLEIYLNGAQPEGENFAALCKIVRQAAINIDAWHKRTGGERIKTFHTLCRTTVADMANNRFDEGI